MVESAAVYEALGKPGAAAFRSPPQTLPNNPVSNQRCCLLKAMEMRAWLHGWRQWQ